MEGIISAGHELTARAGIEMLEKGGNAFDAAVAACFASFVVESVLTSPAGGGFLMAHVAGEKQERAARLYDFFTDVPGLSGAVDSEKMRFFSVYIDFAGAVQELHIGEGSAALPGTVAGLDLVHRNHCTMPLGELMAPAIRYASKGIELNGWQAYFNNMLEPMLGITEEARRVYAPNGTFLREGDCIKNPDMAAAFSYLASEGLDKFYTGDIGERILEGFSVKGLISRVDLASYRAVERRPLSLDYRGRRIFTNPPPSSGGCLVAFALKLLEGFDVSSIGHNTSRYLKLLADVMKVTDEARRGDFDHRVHEDGFAQEFLSPAMVGGYLERLGRLRAGADEPNGSGSTTQISVIDGRGNAASVTTSTGIGCGYMIPGTGIMMNNMLGEDDLNPHGFHVQSAGTRMSSMMAPTIVMKGSSPEIVLGSGGSKRIRNAILQVIVNIIDHGLKVGTAVNIPRVHWDGHLLHVESGVDASELKVFEELAAASGMELRLWDTTHMYFGGVHAAVTSGADFTGAGDSRRGGVTLKTTHKRR